MKDVIVDRRISTRRKGRLSGRRATDLAHSSTTASHCPRCRGSVTILAGEAEGGWWFVCAACDYLWDRRALLNQPMPHPEVALGVTTLTEPPYSSRLASAASSWWRFALGRTS